MENSIDYVAKLVAEISNKFEKNNSELKRLYLLKNILAFKMIAARTPEYRGSFGTGYPFYALKEKLTGQLPIIDEQIRYNNQLVDFANSSSKTDWKCSKCLSENYDIMPDLKQICKPCPSIDNELKPRKIINRLPDIDMWMICEDGHVPEASEKLTELLKQCNMNTSDTNPIQTIKDMHEIVQNIEDGIMPKKFLPIDAHIIEYSKLESLIKQVPSTLFEAFESQSIPYLPIHPLSLRKDWQYDDEAYNFIHDYLSSFTEFNVDKNLNNLLTSTRGIVSTNLSMEQLYKFLLETGPDSVKRRHENPNLRLAFENRINSWRTKNKKEKGEDEKWQK